MTGHRLFADLRKDAALADVHAETALGNEGGKPRARMFRAFVAGGPKPTAPVQIATDKAAWSITVPVTKVDDEIGVIYGWASVIEEGGQIVTDCQGDQISETDMLKAAHGFMLSSRTGGLMHWPGPDGVVKGGDVVESLMFTRDLQKALGIDLGKSGWLIGYKPHDPDVLALAKAGKLAAFSIGGKGVRRPVVTQG